MNSGVSRGPSRCNPVRKGEPMRSDDRTRRARDLYLAFAPGDRDAVELIRGDGSRARNTEILTFEGDRTSRAEVYFGWNL